MRISVESRIHRTLRKLELFKPSQHLDDVPQIRGVPPDFRENEKLIGVYENVRGSVDDVLLFTNVGIHLMTAAGWRRFAYADIQSVEILDQNKYAADTLVIFTKEGLEIKLIIGGGHKLTRDVFEVLRLLNRVMQDISEFP